MDKLNGTLYRFFYIALLKYQSGQIRQWENCWGPDRSTCIKTRDMGITWMCEILIITLFVILMVIPLAVVLIAVEFMTRGEAPRKNRVCNSGPFNTYALANL